MPILDAGGRPIGDLEPRTDDEMVSLMAAELRLQALDGPAVFAFDPRTTLILCGLVQLALRHPDMTPAHADAGRAFIDGVRQYFVDAPAVLAVIDRGDAPHDGQ